MLHKHDWVPAEGTVVAQASKTAVGFEKSCIVDLRPVVGEPFQAEVAVPWSLRGWEPIQPQVGEITGFLVDLKSGKAEFNMSDPRNNQAKRSERANAALADAARKRHRDEDGQGVKWVVPAECPYCGAPVEQAAACLADSPHCSFCSRPLPVQPVT